MDYLQAIVLAIVQGITEWLPVSSSAHLAIASRIFQIETNLFYFVILHLATLVSLGIYFRKRIFSFFFDIKGGKILTKKGWYVVYASIPIFLAGFFLHDLIESMFVDFRLIGMALIANGLILLSTKLFNGEKEITLHKAIGIGIVQMFALIPGISRSGVTVSSGFFAKMKKDEVIMFSMMLSIPAILGAFLYELFTVPYDPSLSILSIIGGFIVAVGCGYFALRLLIKRIRQGRFNEFWSYCIVVGIIMLFN